MHPHLHIFPTAKIWKQPKCPAKTQWTKKLWGGRPDGRAEGHELTSSLKNTKITAKWLQHTKTSFLYPHTKKPGYWDTHRILGQTCMLVLTSERWVVTVAHFEDKDKGGRSFGEYSLVWALLEADTLIKQPVGPSMGTPQVKLSTGQEHSPTHWQTGCLSLPEPTVAY